jgi:hypothetical protein
MDMIQGTSQASMLSVQPPPPQEEREPVKEEQAETTEVRESGTAVDTYA